MTDTVETAAARVAGAVATMPGAGQAQRLDTAAQRLDTAQNSAVRVTVRPPPPAPNLAPPRAENSVKLPVSVSDVAILRTVGIDQLAAFILEGDTHTEIARSLGVPRSSLTAFLHNLDGDEREVIRAAMQASAEPIYDDAGALLDNGDSLILRGPDVALLQARAAHRRIRAGQRNARFKEKGAPAEDAAPGATPGATFTFHLELAPQGPAENIARLLDGTAERVE